MRIRLAWLALALIGLGAVALDGVALGRLGHSPPQARVQSAPGGSVRCYGMPGYSAPELVSWAFLHAAVARGGLDAAYQLTTPSFRRGLGCARWLQDPRVAAFKPIDYGRSLIRARSQTSTQIVYDVQLVGGGRSGRFRLVLARPSPLALWRVAGWRPLPTG